MTVFDHHVIGPEFAQPVPLCRVPRGRKYREPLCLRVVRGHQPDRRGPAPDQQGLSRRDPERQLQRPPGGVKHFRRGGKLCPVQRRLHRVDMGRRDGRKFRIPAVIGAAHPAGGRDDGLAGFEIRPRRGLDDTGAFDSQHPRERHGRRMAEPRIQFPAVEPEGHDADQHAPGNRLGARPVLPDFQHLRTAGTRDHDGAHRPGAHPRKSCKSTSP